MSTFLQLVEEPFREMILKFRVFLPNLMAMLTILVLGLAVSWALKRLLVKMLDLFHFDRWSDRMGLTALLRREGLWPKPSLAVGAIVFWSSLLLFTMMALSVLKLEAVRLLISQSFLYLPRIVSAVLLVLARVPGNRVREPGRTHCRGQQRLSQLTAHRRGGPAAAHGVDPGDVPGAAPGGAKHRARSVLHRFRRNRAGACDRLRRGWNRSGAEGFQRRSG